MASSSTKRISYAQRLFLWLLGYSFLLVGGFVFFQYNREKEFKTAEVNSQLQIINHVMLDRLAEGDDPRVLAAEKFPPFDTLRVSVLDRSGNVVFDNFGHSLPAINHSGREEVREAMATGSGFAVHRHSATTGETYFYSATQGADGTIVRTAVPYSLSLDSLLRADYGFLRIMAIITLIMCTLGFFATRRLGLHISRLNHFAENAERGVRISEIEPFPHDELGEISNHIVRLYAELQQANADRDREHRLAMHEQQEKERIKKQLTNNINHELKTPVASIQVCLETMADHPGLDADRRMEFLNRGLSQCHRLNKLLADVSLITRMDDGSGAIVREPVDLSEIIREVAADKAPAAGKAGITIDNRVEGPLALNGNSTLLSSIFNNLIDNAIAYSGASRITVTAVSDPRNIHITFSDNGTGVPEMHLPRLFERFYRIDKGRSRAAGGTGLGLAIVKNAVTILHGTISVANRKEGGLRFSIRLARDFTET